MTSGELLGINHALSFQDVIIATKPYKVQNKDMHFVHVLILLLHPLSEAIFCMDWILMTKGKSQASHSQEERLAIKDHDKRTVHLLHILEYLANNDPSNDYKLS